MRIFDKCIMTIMITLVWCLPALAQKEIDKHVRYGQPEGIDPPKTIIFSVGPDGIASDAQTWAGQKVQAFFLDNVAREWSTDIWAADKAPWTIGESDETLQKARTAANAAREAGSDVFLKVAFDHYFEWFNDIAWQRIDNNFRQFAIFAREAGCTGVALDIEYCGKQYSYTWEGYDYQGYTREDLFNKVRERMTHVMEILYDEFPDMVFLTFPENGFSLGTAIHSAWIEVAAKRNAPGGVHYCTEGTYRSPDIRWMLAYAATLHTLFRHVLSDEAYAYWQNKGSLSIGVWPFGFDYQAVQKPGMTLEELRQAYAGSLMLSTKYNWLYGHNCVEQLAGRNLDQYKGTPGLDAYLQVIKDREMITTPKYVKLAKELRAMRYVDPEQITGFAPSIMIAGPDDLPRVGPTPAKLIRPEHRDHLWQVAMDYYQGRVVDTHALFNTQTDWMIIGPFANPETYEGHNTVYPPEKEINFEAVYEGMSGPVKWQAHHQDSLAASVDLRAILEPGEHATAYALCYVNSPKRQRLQARFGTNDAGKMWIGGKLIHDYKGEATAILDEHVVNITLPEGKTPILMKVSNGVNNWGLVFRITEKDGSAPEGLAFTLE